MALPASCTGTRNTVKTARISRIAFTFEEELTMGRKDYLGGGIFIALGFSLRQRRCLTRSSKEDTGAIPVPRVLAVLFIFFGGVVVLHGWRSPPCKRRIP